ncbi:MAG: DUF58 domain-containing protein [Verrucomicrobia bacterium]|nr:DUF58 domain-containing protein [Verrucomicrobiota bacterium]
MVDFAERAEHWKLLDNEALTRVRGHEFIARGLVQGAISGRHRSPYKGFSSEFAEHREYAPGDPLSDLDWRVYGRSDRYYIKQYVEETNLRATILLDASGSMSYAGGMAAERDGKRLNKFEFAQRLAACLAHLLINQQDAVGLVTLDTKIRQRIPARSRTTHLQTLIQELYATEPGDETALAPIFHDVAESIPRRSVVFVISDLFDDPTALLEALHHFRYRRHEVVVLHVMAQEELTFPFQRWSLFEDLEDVVGDQQIDPRSIRAAYLREVQNFVSAMESGCGRLHIDYVQMSTQQPYDVALSNYLAHRKSLAGIASRGSSRFSAT